VQHLMINRGKIHTSARPCRSTTGLDNIPCSNERQRRRIKCPPVYFAPCCAQQLLLLSAICRPVALVPCCAPSRSIIARVRSDFKNDDGVLKQRRVDMGRQDGSEQRMEDGALAQDGGGGKERTGVV
jgi:hypothetical protein